MWEKSEIKSGFMFYQGVLNKIKGREETQFYSSVNIGHIISKSRQFNILT